MAKSVKLLLVENVDSLGIVGDVVNVRLGYARNFLLPRALATEPSEELMKSLAGKRAEAERQLAALRKDREETSAKLAGVELTLIRACNDMGHLYASVTQQEIATALAEKGFNLIKPRDVRMSQVIKRIDNYDVHVKLDSDLDAIVKLHVQPDRKLDLHKDEPAPAPPPAEGEAPAEGDGERKGKRSKGDRGDKGGEPKPEGEAKPAVKGFKSMMSKPEPKTEGKPDANKAEKPAKKEKPKA